MVFVKIFKNKFGKNCIKGVNMSQLEELKQIKKLYGERFMKLCRKNFSTILEYEGVLLNTLKATFSNNSKKLCEDICNENMEETFDNTVQVMFLRYKTVLWYIPIIAHQALF